MTSWTSTSRARDLDAIAIPSAADPPSLGRWVETSLRGSGHLALRGVVCDSRGDIVRLRGCLSTYLLKQVAETIGGEVEGVRLIINRIVVGVSTDDPPIGSDRARAGGKKSLGSGRQVRL
jgi:hypothetical protein